jgi:hypothetical protein
MIYIEESLIEKRITSVQSFLENKIDSDVPEHVKIVIARCSEYLATSAHIVGSCEYWLQERKNLAYKNEDLQCSLLKLPASLQKGLIESFCSKEIANLTFAQRQNACLVHQIDAYRSILSYAKAEMEQLRQK